MALLALLAVGAAASPADAGTPRHFANCTQMHTVYVGGVAKVGAVDRRAHGGHATYRPTVSTPLYSANTKMDRDGDGVACEK